jgi:hypothetical protein
MPERKHLSGKSLVLGKKSLSGWAEKAQRVGAHLVDGENRTISYIKLRWRLTGTISYEAELQLRNHGKSDGVPVCCMKSGYASGFATTLVGRTILFREVECMGCGHPRCHVIGKTVELWGGNAAEELKLMQPDRVADRLIALQEQVSILRHSLGNEIDIGFMIGARHACSRARQVSSAVGTCADPTRGSLSVDGRAISLLSGVGGVAPACAFAGAFAKARVQASSGAAMRGITVPFGLPTAGRAGAGQVPPSNP